jgi:outer membrane immunogenic protein
MKPAEKISVWLSKQNRRRGWTGRLDHVTAFQMERPMNRLLSAIALPIAFCACAAPALAADIPGRRAPQQQFYAPPAFTWTGFYLGANAGANWGDFTNSASFLGTKTGLTVGGTAGYNYQIGQIVVGLEGDYNYSGLGGRGFSFGVNQVRGDLTSFGTLRGRLGVAFDRALIYATGGYAVGFTSLESGAFKSNNTHHGYAIGAGLEYGFTNNISAKAEYLYMPLGSQSSFVIPGLGAGSKTGIDASVLRAGVNYRF